MQDFKVWRLRVLHLFCRPDSFRVMNPDVENTSKPMPPVTTMTLDENVLGQPRDSGKPGDHRCNRPNATHVGFLRHDTRVMLQPVCDVKTAEQQSRGQHWLAHIAPEEPTKIPERTLDSTARKDFQWRADAGTRNTRHSSNPQKSPVLGCGQPTSS